MWTLDSWESKSLNLSGAFAFKSDTRYINVNVFVITLVIFILYNGTFLYGFERFYWEADLPEEWYDFFDVYNNKFFLPLTTVFGVGLENFFSASGAERAITALACIAFYAMVAIVIRGVHASLVMTSKETSAYHILA